MRLLLEIVLFRDAYRGGASLSKVPSQVSGIVVNQQYYILCRLKFVVMLHDDCQPCGGVSPSGGKNPLCIYTFAASLWECFRWTVGDLFV